MESVKVKFDDKKIQGLHDEGFHVELHFKNEVDFEDDGESDEFPHDYNQERISIDNLESTSNSSSTANASTANASTVNASTGSKSIVNGSTGNINSQNNITSHVNSNQERSNISGGASNDQSNHSHHFTNDHKESSRRNLSTQRKWTKDHPFELIIGDPEVGVKNQMRYSRRMSSNCILISRRAK